MLNGGASTGPMFRTVLGVDTALPVSVAVGAARDRTTRSGRKSRIVTAEALAVLIVAPTGSLSTMEKIRLPLRREAFWLKIGTANGLTTSPTANWTMSLRAT